MHKPPRSVWWSSNPRIVLGDENEKDGVEGQCSLEASPELDSVNHDGGRPPDRPILHSRLEAGIISETT